MSLRPLVTILALFVVTPAVTPAFAQSVEIDYTCGCEKRNDKISHGCQGGTPSVTVQSSANGKDDARNKAGMNLCYRAFGTSCPQHSCLAKVTKTGERVVTKEDQAARKQAKATGISTKHADGLAKFAKDNGLTIIVRTTNTKSLPYQDEAQAKYRPKPLALSALNTAPSGEHAGLIVKPDWQRLIAAEDPSKKADEVDREIATLAQDCAKATPEQREKEQCGWYLDNHSVLRDAKKRAVYGDYDLQGVYDKKKLLDTNDTKEGKQLRKRLNEALDASRTDEQQWLIQHGANDNYRNKKDKTKMGREPGLDEDFMVFEPDGAKVHVPNLSELKTYYTDHGISWPYKNP